MFEQAVGLAGSKKEPTSASPYGPTSEVTQPTPTDDPEDAAERAKEKRTQVALAKEARIEREFEKKLWRNDSNDTKVTELFKKKNDSEDLPSPRSAALRVQLAYIFSPCL